MEKRLDDIEATFGFQELALERLSKEVREQQKEIILLREEIKDLKALYFSNEALSNDDNEKPPHY